MAPIYPFQGRLVLNRFLVSLFLGAAIWLENLASSPDGEIPDVLAKHLFGGPERTYAVFDTATVREGLALIDAETCYCGSLLEGDVARELADVMPCLVELSPDAS